MDLRFCPYCGAPRVEQAPFCGSCGKPIAGTSPSGPALAGTTPATPASSHWEYADYVYTYQPGWRAYRVSVSAAPARSFSPEMEMRSQTELSARLDAWHNSQMTIMPELQRWLDDGWEPASEVGPAGIALRIYRSRTKGGDLSRRMMSAPLTLGLSLAAPGVQWVEPQEFRVHLHRRRRSTDETTDYQVSPPQLTADIRPAPEGNLGSPAKLIPTDQTARTSRWSTWARMPGLLALAGGMVAITSLWLPWVSNTDGQWAAPSGASIGGVFDPVLVGGGLALVCGLLLLRAGRGPTWHRLLGLGAVAGCLPVLAFSVLVYRILGEGAQGADGEYFSGLGYASGAVGVGVFACIGAGVAIAFGGLLALVRRWQPRAT
jgi:hypothetical protein